MLTDRRVKRHLVKVSCFTNILIIQVPEYLHSGLTMRGVADHPAAVPINFEWYVYFGTFPGVDYLHWICFPGQGTIGPEGWQNMILVVLGLVIILHRRRQYKPVFSDHGRWRYTIAGYLPLTRCI